MSTIEKTLDASHKQFQQLISHLVEGVLFVESGGTIAWANEAALAMHNCKQLSELGVTAAQYHKNFVLTYLNHHKLTAKQYPVARAISGEKFNDVRVELRLRSPKNSDTDFRRVLVMYSVPFIGQDKKIEAVAVVIKDETEQANAEERFERAFTVNPAPAIICRLSDNRFIKVNHGFLEMTGYSADQIIDKSLYELDVLREAEYREQAIQSLQLNEPITQQKVVLRIQGGDEKFAIVAGRPIEVDDEACMMFTFIDLDKHRQTEKLLEHSKDNFSKIFDLTPTPMMMCVKPTWHIVAVNKAFEATIGYGNEKIKDNTLFELDLWVDTKKLEDIQKKLYKDSSVRDYEVALRTSESVVLNMLLSVETITFNDDSCVLCAFEDVTNRKRTEVELMDAIDAVMQDTSWFSQNVMEKLAQLRHSGITDAKSGLSILTEREKEVLHLICQGKSNANIATILKISCNTVRNHVAAIYDKIGVHRRSDAVIWGRERGLTNY